MALKGKWTDKTDGIDIASAEDINSVAHAVMELEDGIENVSGVYVGSGEMPEGYNVQIDPNGEATPFPDVELIKSGELSENFGWEIINTADDHATFKLFDRVEIYVEMPKAPASGKLAVSFDGTNISGQVNNAMDASNAKTVRMIWQYGTMGWYWMGCAVNAGNEYAAMQMQMRFFSDRWTERTVSSIKLYNPASGGVLPAGMKYWVYGRREK